ncbi:MAG: UvrD-helicase domain-containing protein [Rikenellaceae bacterium]
MGSIKIIKASAGSGKTYRLTLEYIRMLIISPESYRNILAVTFTNKATSEMKERILRELNALSNYKPGDKNLFYEQFVSDEGIDSSKIVLNAQKALRYILHDYTFFSVFTIDKFFQKILRSFVRELGLEGGYNIKFDNEYTTLMAIDRVIDSSKYDSKLQLIIESIIDDNLSNNRSANVKESLRRLTGSINNQSSNTMNDDLEPLFQAVEREYNKEVIKIKEQAIKVTETIKGLESDQLPGKSRSFVSDLKKIKSGVITYGKNTEKTANGEGKWGSSVKPRQGQIVRELSKLIEMIDSSQLLRNTCSAVLKNYRSFLLLEKINEEIANITKESGSLMISKSMNILSKLISENEVPFIYEKAGNYYSRFMIDEFQDTSTDQWKNFVPLINEALAYGSGDNVTLLGDVKQSIYGWRGGNWRLLQGDLYSDISNNQSIAPPDTLTTNWRSQPNIIGFNNCFMAKFIAKLNNFLNEQIEGSDEVRELLGNQFIERNRDVLKKAYDDLHQDVSPKAIEGRGYVNVSYCDYDSQNHMKQMINAIESAQDRGYSASDIAILVRSNKEATQVANYITEYSSNGGGDNNKYCYDFMSQQALKLSYSREVNLIISAMRVSQISNLQDGDIETLRFNSLYHGSFSGELSLEDKTFLDSLKYLSLLESFEAIISHLEIDKKESCLPYIQALHEKMINFSADNSVDVVHFLEWWENEGSSAVIYIPQNGSSMFIATVHLSKGLEFKVVILPFARQKLGPKSGSAIWVNSSVKPFDMLGDVVVGNSSSLAQSYFAESYYDLLLNTHIESANTLYVALTRSCEELYLMLSSVKKPEIYDMVIEDLYRENIISLVEKNNQSLPDFSDKSYQMGVRGVVTDGDDENSFNTIYLGDYKSINYKDRLKIRVSTRRYYLENGDGILSPRHYGVIMHKLFERINSSEQVSDALNEMEREGVISAEDKQSAKEAIERAFENPIISDWFDSRWRVRAENDILLPVSSEGGLVTYRPDRVLTHGDEAVVIDYKFGLKSNKHLKQVENYKSLLSQMGYKDVKGYVWYVLENDVTMLQ